MQALHVGVFFFFVWANVLATEGIHRVQPQLVLSSSLVSLEMC